jgi:hypothetical protein
VRLNFFAHISFIAVQPRPERDVVEDAHGKGIRLLKDHPDVAVDQHWIDPRCVNDLTAEMDVSFEAEPAHQVVQTIETP